MATITTTEKIRISLPTSIMEGARKLRDRRFPTLSIQEVLGILVNDGLEGWEEEKAE